MTLSFKKSVRTKETLNGVSSPMKRVNTAESA